MDDNRKIFSLITDGFNPDYQERNNNKICMFTKPNNEGEKTFSCNNATKPYEINLILIQINQGVFCLNCLKNMK